MTKHRICFKFLKKIYMIMAHFAKYRLFRGWFQVLSVVSWLVSGSFGWFQVVPGRLLFKQVHRRSYKKQSMG